MLFECSLIDRVVLCDSQDIFVSLVLLLFGLILLRCLTLRYVEDVALLRERSLTTVYDGIV